MKVEYPPGTLEQIFAKMYVLGAEIYPEPENIEHAKYFKKVSDISGAEEGLEMVVSEKKK